MVLTISWDGMIQVTLTKVRHVDAFGQVLHLLFTRNGAIIVKENVIKRCFANFMANLPEARL